MAREPSINNIRVALINPPNTVNYYVEGITKLKVNFDAYYGPNVSSGKCSVGYYGESYNPYGGGYEGYIYNEKTVSGNSPEVVLEPAIHSSIVGIEMLGVQNKYGDDVTKTYSLSADGGYLTFSYKEPNVSISTERCDYYGTPSPQGSYVKMTIKGKSTILNGDNTLTLSALWRSVGSGSWNKQFVSVPSSAYIGDGTFETNTIISGVPLDGAYEFKAQLSDLFKTSDSNLAHNGKVVISRLAGGKGVTFFREATKEGFYIDDVKMDLDTYNNANYRFPIKDLGRWILDHGDVHTQLKMDLYGDDGSGGIDGRLSRVENNLNGSSYTISSYGNFSVSGGGGYYKDMRLVLVRCEAKVNAECAALGQWKVGTSNCAENPPYRVALSAYCEARVTLNASINTSGEIHVRPQGKLPVGTTVYITGMYRL